MSVFQLPRADGLPPGSTTNIVRCHNPESTAERVSNFDNLEVKPRLFTEGDTLNKMSGPDLTAIIDHGGPA